MTKDGLRKPNYWGSLTQAATLRIGNYEGEEVSALHTGWPGIKAHSRSSCNWVLGRFDGTNAACTPYCITRGAAFYLLPTPSL